MTSTFQGATDRFLQSLAATFAGCLFALPAVALVGYGFFAVCS